VKKFKAFSEGPEFRSDEASHPSHDTAAVFGGVCRSPCMPPYMEYSSSSKIRTRLLSVNTAYSPMEMRSERINRSTHTMERKACE
jgi:hypothetical protein